jgi:hypothetical protein
MLELGFSNFFICGAYKESQTQMRLVYDFSFNETVAVELFFQFLNENPQFKEALFEKFCKAIETDELIKSVKL